MWRQYCSLVFLQNDVDDISCMPTCKQVLCDLLVTSLYSKKQFLQYTVPRIAPGFCLKRNKFFFFTWKMNQRMSTMDNHGSKWFEESSIIPWDQCLFLISDSQCGWLPLVSLAYHIWLKCFSFYRKNDINTTRSTSINRIVKKNGRITEEHSHQKL